MLSAIILVKHMSEVKKVLKLIDDFSINDVKKVLEKCESTVKENNNKKALRLLKDNSDIKKLKRKQIKLIDKITNIRHSDNYVDYHMEFELSFSLNGVESGRSYIGDTGGDGYAKTRIADDNLNYEEESISGYEFFHDLGIEKSEYETKKFKKISNDVKLTIDEYIELILTVLTNIRRYL